MNPTIHKRTHNNITLVKMTVHHEQYMIGWDKLRAAGLPLWKRADDFVIFGYKDWLEQIFNVVECKGAISRF